MLVYIVQYQVHKYKKINENYIKKNKTQKKKIIKSIQKICDDIHFTPLG